MKKLGKKQYIKLISEAMVNTYGATLAEFDTDLDMAEAVLKKLKPYLNFNTKDMTPKEFTEWRNKVLDQE